MTDVTTPTERTVPLPALPQSHAARRTLGGGWEVRDDRGRVAYLPARAGAPGRPGRVARVVAAALSQLDRTRERIEIRDDEGRRTLSVWDGDALLAEFVYLDQISRPATLARAGSFADGYVSGRALCLGDRT